MAFCGAPEAADWLSQAYAEKLLAAQPGGNISPDQAADFVSEVVNSFAALQPELDAAAQRRADELLQAHRRVRDAARSGGSVRVEAQPTPDVLGLWVYLPML